MKKICFITSCLSFGGAEKVLLWIANQCVLEGDQVFIIDLKSNVNNSGYRRAVNPNIRVIEAEAKGIRVIKRISQIHKVCRIVRNEKPNIVIGFTTYPSFLAQISAKRAHVPSIVSERCDPSFELKSLLNRFYHFFINKADGAVFQIEGAMKYYSKKLQQKAVIIPNPIFQVPQAASESTDKSFVTIGRFDNKQKRYDLLIDAFCIFHHKHSDYVLKIYGDGRDKDFIKKYIKNKKCEEFVLLNGYTSNPFEEMGKSQVFVLSSDYEGIPNSLLEAMAFGMPVISTDTSPGGARMLIENEKNGLLVRCGDSEMLANAMSMFVENADIRRKCAENAKNVLSLFSPEVIWQKWVSYLKSF